MPKAMRACISRREIEIERESARAPELQRIHNLSVGGAEHASL